MTVAGRSTPASAARSASARSVPSPYGRCFVSLRFAKAISEKWMWKGAPGASTSAAAASASANGSTPRNAPSLVACMCAKSRTGRTQPVRREISTTSSSDPRTRPRPTPPRPEGTPPPLASEPLPKCAELLDDGSERVLAASPEQEAGMEDDELGSARRRDPGTAVERAHGGRELSPAGFEVPHEAAERCVHGEGDVMLAGQLPEALCERVVHP